MATYGFNGERALSPIPPLEANLLTPLVGKTMLELGNKRNAKGTFKEYFTGVGIEHTSVDLNGKDGALKLDLMEPLGLGRFDMVTNFGTTEHVARQEPAWRNIVEAAAAVIVSTTPLPGDWKKHGRWYPTEAFYRELARRNGFTVQRLYVDGPVGKRLIFVRMLRWTEAEFAMPDEGLIFDNGDFGVGEAP